MTPPAENQGLPQLDTAIKVLGQVNLLLAGVPGIIALGASLVQLIKTTGRSDEESQAEVDKFNSTVSEALQFNKDWKPVHPAAPVPGNPAEPNVDRTAAEKPRMPMPKTEPASVLAKGNQPTSPATPPADGTKGNITVPKKAEEPPSPEK